MNPKLIKQFLQYATVGVVALGVDVGTFMLCRSLGLELVAANVFARFVGSVTAYIGNFLWTFAQPTNMAEWLSTSWRYAAVWAGATTLSTLLLSALTGFGWNETACKLGVEMAMPFVNFVIARVWVFKGK